jgi:hypothetical protein
MEYACSLKHLKSLYTFPDRSGKVVMADFEQQFNSALVITCPV